MSNGWLENWNHAHLELSLFENVSNSKTQSFIQCHICKVNFTQAETEAHRLMIIGVYGHMLNPNKTTCNCVKGYYFINL